MLPYDEGASVPYTYGTYGYKRSNGTIHNGIDLVGIGNKRINAVAAGRVKYARQVPKGAAGWGNTWEWGKFVWIDGFDGFAHIYAHCAALYVEEGATVKEGETIALEGNTGNAALNNPPYTHCHYEVRQGKIPVNPCGFLGIQNKVGSYYNTYPQVKPKYEGYYMDGKTRLLTLAAPYTLSKDMTEEERKATIDMAIKDFTDRKTNPNNANYEPKTILDWTNPDVIYIFVPRKASDSLQDITNSLVQGAIII